jgi:type IX secretion system PorP/SprF family membrane protein
MNLKKSYLLLLVFIAQFSFAQEGVAVYSDYLSDNLYLLHPSMAGAANCAQARVTARQQWFDVENAPRLQTASFNTRVGERSGIGAIVFNDRNGYHSQNGVKLTYAHHLRFSRSDYDLNQLSFGISGAIIQSQLDETSFINGQPFDPIIGGIYQKDNYFNVDLGMSYFYLDFFAHFTVKNAIANMRRQIYTEFESDNLRKYIVSAGQVFGDSDRLLWEPSIMFQFTEQTQEKAIDLNMKVYKELDFGRLWGGISYRSSFDGAQFVDGSSISNQRLQYITPILGLNFKEFMFAYTYSHIMGNVRFDNAGFHQITIGINLFCAKKRWNCNCPAVN